MGRFALPGVVVIGMTLCMGLLWRRSEVTTAPIADRRLNGIYSLEEGEVLRARAGVVRLAGLGGVPTSGGVAVGWGCARGAGMICGRVRVSVRSAG